MTGRLARLLGYDSPVPLVWMWHAVFDGGLCRCARSRQIREYL